jgi:hypothetical protein
MSSTAKSKSARSQPQAEPEKKFDPPVWSRRIFTGSGSVECAVFSKMMGEGDQQWETFNASLKRSYKDGDQFKSVSGLRMEDVPVAIQLLSQAYDFIASQNNPD